MSTSTATDIEVVPQGVALPDEVRLGETSLIFEGDISQDKWEDVLRTVASSERAATRAAATATWWLADLLAYGEGVYATPYERASEITGRTVRGLYQLAYLARAVPPERRQPELSITHHRSVAALEPTEQERFLAAAAGSGWSVSELEGTIRADRETLPPAGRFEDPELGLDPFSDVPFEDEDDEPVDGVYAGQEESERVSQAILDEALGPHMNWEDHDSRELAREIAQTAAAIALREFKCPRCAYEWDGEAR